MARAETPLVAVRPGDDLLAPAYLAALHAALGARPEEALAFSDLLFDGRGLAERGPRRCPAGRIGWRRRSST